MNMPILVAGLLALASCGNVLAAQLGQLSTYSRLGEALNARIELYGVGAEQAAALKLELKPDITAPHGSAERAAAGAIEARIVTDTGARTYISLSSDLAINEPVVSFRLRASSGETTTIGSYTLALPPGPRPAPRARSAGTRTTTVQQIAGARSYGPVRSGQTLWRILRDLGMTNGDTATLIEQIVAANPNAFVNADANRLRVGVTLDIPRSTVPVSAAPAENLSAAVTQPSSVPVADTAPSTTNATATPATATPATATPATATPATATPAVATPAVATPAVATPAVAAEPAVEAPIAAMTSDSPVVTAARFEDPQTTARLAALATKFAAIKARYAEQQSAPPPSTRAVTSAAPGASSEPGEPVPATPPQPVPAETAASSSPIGSNAIAVGGTSEAPRSTSLRMTIIMAISALIALVVLIRGGFFAYARWQRSRADNVASTGDQRLVAEIALKAEKRLRLEDEVKRRISNKREIAAVPPSTIERSIERVEHSERAEASVPLEEIENRIAHGQYAEAEAMLNSVIEQSPHNARAKMRLAEIYFLNERVDEFVTLAGEISARHRDDIGDEGWQRVMRMGKLIAPERPPFSGPVRVQDHR